VHWWGETWSWGASFFYNFFKRKNPNPQAPLNSTKPSDKIPPVNKKTADAGIFSRVWRWAVYPIRRFTAKKT